MSKKTFNISSHFYSQELLQDARSAFGEFNIEILPDTVIIDEDDAWYVFDEFMNYTLSLSLESSVWV